MSSSSSSFVLFVHLPHSNLPSVKDTNAESFVGPHHLLPSILATQPVTAKPKPSIFPHITSGAEAQTPPVQHEDGILCNPTVGMCGLDPAEALD